MRWSNSVKHNSSSLSENWAGVSQDPQETMVFLTKKSPKKFKDRMFRQIFQGSKVWDAQVFSPW